MSLYLCWRELHGSRLCPKQTLSLAFLRDMEACVDSQLDFYADDCTLHVIEYWRDRSTAAIAINADISIIHHVGKHLARQIQR